MTNAAELADDILANWPYPPKGGWTADHLDRLPLDGPNGEPEFFIRVELIDGALVFRSPQTRFHERMVSSLRIGLSGQAPAVFSVVGGMDLWLDAHSRTCPDVMVIDAVAGADLDRTSYQAEEVYLVVEVVSPESAHRDRVVKPPKYARSGISHFWRVEKKENQLVVYVFELDPATCAYGLVKIDRGRVAVDLPFPVDIAFGNAG
ncbi:Uma2 family endonuclease [Acrocarpospora macrocephala]|uniref:Putative restriction endonuclease domain-containing protein n=1 Tax=Acrocarpospora macrocephala TaxID=150177 RepID=A0A5M3X013_9ACTN|nr:hypothetical protein Amac_076030 [Acrocarpospora macrocephala]